MLLAGPAIRRSSVRSVATAAKAKVSVDSSSANTPPPELQHRTELPPDRAAALARSKWAAKPKPSDQASSQAGPSTPAPTVARPSTPMQPFRSFVAEPPAKTTMWDLSTPTIAQTPGEKWAAQLSATTKWARREHLTTASPDPPSFEELVSADDLQIKPDKSSGRTRWPPLSTSPPSTSKRDAWRVAGEKTSWNERLEPAWTNTRSAESRTGPRSNVPPQTTNSPLTEQWTLPQPSQPPKLPAHLRWQPPDPPPAALRDSIPVSPSESSKGLAAPPHSVLDTLLPPKALSPDSQLQRDVAPHLAPRPPGKLSHPDHQLQAQSLRFVAPQSAAKTALPRRPEKTAAVPERAPQKYVQRAWVPLER
ncbi:hypothetical protein B0H15DRAFT_257703 [Mycena belliarum]|uniref:Uncharacterized protein n=1 Tax=Mycena belliarum TaxID=1033014 RepID=A0AAD6U9V4_9AGAR|nr:hypothetical protein B0H15DRAFT_257703 [Mycena belliae]